MKKAFGWIMMVVVIGFGSNSSPPLPVPSYVANPANNSVWVFNNPSTLIWVNNVDSNAGIRAVRVKEATAIGEDLKQAILSQNIKPILQYFNLADFKKFKEKVEKDLEDPKSRFYVNLFGPGGMKEYFQTATDQKTRVNFRKVYGKEDLDWACIRYMSSNYSVGDWPETCLLFRDGKFGIFNLLSGKGEVSTAESHGDARAARVKELMAMAEDLKQAILSQDIKRILHYVNKGIGCVDSLVEFKEVEKDLRDPKSRLYANLFGPGSMKEYFQTATDQKARVDFMKPKGKEDLNWACLRYMSSNYVGYDWPEICLFFRDGKWGITDSLYDCV